MPTRPYHLANGDRVSGVTTVLSLLAKPALVPWANGLGFEGINSTVYVDYVAGAGTLAHRMIERHLIGGTLDTLGYDDNQVSMAQRALSGFLAWAGGKSLAVREVELGLVSERYRYGGTVDALLLIDGVPTLLDFKTSTAIWDDHVYQLAAYHQLLIENGYEVAEARVLQVGRDEGEGFSERVLDVEDIIPYFRVFQAALVLKGAIDATRRGR